MAMNAAALTSLIAASPFWARFVGVIRLIAVTTGGGNVIARNLRRHVVLRDPGRLDAHIVVATQARVT